MPKRRHVQRRTTVDAIQSQGAENRYLELRAAYLASKHKTFLAWLAQSRFVNLMADGLGWFLSFCNSIGAGANSYYVLHAMAGVACFNIESATGLLIYEIFCYLQFLIISKQNLSNYNREMRRTTMSWTGANDDPLVAAAESIDDHLKPSWSFVKNVLWQVVSFLGAAIKAAMGSAGMMSAIQNWAGYAVAMGPLLPLTLTVAAVIFMGSFLCNISQQGRELKKNKEEMPLKLGILRRTAERLFEYEDVLRAAEISTEDDLNEIKARQLKKKESQKKKGMLSRLLSVMKKPFVRKAPTDPLRENLLITMRERDVMSSEWSRLLKIKLHFESASITLKKLLADDAAAGVPTKPIFPDAKEYGGSKNTAEYKKAVANYHKANKAYYRYMNDFEFDSKPATYLTLFGRQSSYLNRPFYHGIRQFFVQLYRVVTSKEVILILALTTAMTATFVAAYFLLPLGLPLAAVMGASALAAAASLLISALVFEVVFRQKGESFLDIFRFKKVKDRLFEMRQNMALGVSGSNALGAGLDAWFSFPGVVAQVMGLVMAATTAVVISNPLVIWLCILVVPITYFMNFFMYKQKVQTLSQRHARQYEKNKFELNKKTGKSSTLIFKGQSSFQHNTHNAEKIPNKEPFFDAFKNEIVKWFLMRNGGFIKSLKTSLGSFSTWVNIVQLIGIGVVIGVSVTQPIGIAIAVSLFACAVIVTLAQVSRRVKSSNLTMSATRAALVAMTERAPDERAAEAYEEELEDFLNGKPSFAKGVAELIDEIKFDLGDAVSNDNIDYDLAKEVLQSANLDELLGESETKILKRLDEYIFKREVARRKLEKESALLESDKDGFLKAFKANKNNAAILDSTSKCIYELMQKVNKKQKSIAGDSDALLKRYVDKKYDWSNISSSADAEADVKPADVDSVLLKRKEDLAKVVRNAICRNFFNPDKLIKDTTLDKAFKEQYLKGAKRLQFTKKDKEVMAQHSDWLKKFKERMGGPTMCDDCPDTAKDDWKSSSSRTVMARMYRAKQNLREAEELQFQALYDKSASNETTKRDCLMLHRTREQQRLLRRVGHMADRDPTKAAEYFTLTPAGVGLEKATVFNLANPKAPQKRSSLFQTLTEDNPLNALCQPKEQPSDENGSSSQEQASDEQEKKGIPLNALRTTQEKSGDEKDKDGIWYYLLGNTNDPGSQTDAILGAVLKVRAHEEKHKKTLSRKSTALLETLPAQVPDSPKTATAYIPSLANNMIEEYDLRALDKIQEVSTMARVTSVQDLSM